MISVFIVYKCKYLQSTIIVSFELYIIIMRLLLILYYSGTHFLQPLQVPIVIMYLYRRAFE